MSEYISNCFRILLLVGSCLSAAHLHAKEISDLKFSALRGNAVIGQPIGLSLILESGSAGALDQVNSYCLSASIEHDKGFAPSVLHATFTRLDETSGLIDLNGGNMPSSLISKLTLSVSCGLVNRKKVFDVLPIKKPIGELATNATLMKAPQTPAVSDFDLSKSESLRQSYIRPKVKQSAAPKSIENLSVSASKAVDKEKLAQVIEGELPASDLANPQTTRSEEYLVKAELTEAHTSGGHDQNGFVALSADSPESANQPVNRYKLPGEIVAQGYEILLVAFLLTLGMVVYIYRRKQHDRSINHTVKVAPSVGELSSGLFESDTGSRSTMIQENQLFRAITGDFSEPGQAESTRAQINDSTAFRQHEGSNDYLFVDLIDGIKNAAKASWGLPADVKASLGITISNMSHWNNVSLNYPLALIECCYRRALMLSEIEPHDIDLLTESFREACRHLETTPVSADCSEIPLVVDYVHCKYLDIADPEVNVFFLNNLRLLPSMLQGKPLHFNESTWANALENLAN